MKTSGNIRPGPDDRDRELLGTAELLPAAQGGERASITLKSFRIEYQ